MKISFDTIAESAIENFKGGEGTCKDVVQGIGRNR